MPYLKKVIPAPEPIDCRILTSAMNLFVDYGFHNVSVHKIQKDADVSIGSIYKYFGSKEGIAKALYYHLLNEIDEMIDCVIQQESTTINQCNEIIRQLFNYTESHRNLIAYVLHPRHAEFLPEEPPVSTSEPFKKLRNIIEQGMLKNQIKPGDLWTAYSIIFGSTIYKIQLRIDNIIEEPLPDLLNNTLDNIWTGMGENIN